MPWLEQINLAQFLIFTLVLTRVSGLTMTAPIYGSADVPVRIRALLAFSLALLVAPSQFSTPLAEPANLIEYLVLIGGELLIGVVLGLGIQILFLASQLAGQVISQLGGMSLADVFNPSLESDIPILSQLLYLFGLAVFLTIGGHRLVMAGLLSTFASLPPGTAGLPVSTAETLVTLVAQSLELGLRCAAPAVTALLLVTIIMGLISRTVPQLNIMAVGFGINALATLGTLSLSLGLIAWAFESQIEPFVEALLMALVP